jgi:prepilin-type N-terminal cleavage/methylation domain-containing protein
MKIYNRAYTLVELMVTVSIITMLTSIVVYSYSNFNDKIALTSAGQELAVSIRQAQTFGLNVKENIVGSGSFDSAYGIFFDLSNLDRYIIFADTNKNKLYNSGNGCGSVSTECVNQIIFRDGVTISQICDGSGNCPPAPGFTVRNLNVTFLRPNPDAVINFSDNGLTTLSSASTGRVVITSRKGLTQTISISNTGQVYVQ